MRTHVLSDREKGCVTAMTSEGDKGPGHTFCTPRVQMPHSVSPQRSLPSGSSATLLPGGRGGGGVGQVGGRSIRTLLSDLVGSWPGREGQRKPRAGVGTGRGGRSPRAQVHSTDSDRGPAAAGVGVRRALFPAARPPGSLACSSRTQRKSRGSRLPARSLAAAASRSAGHSWTRRGLRPAASFPVPAGCDGGGTVAILVCGHWFAGIPFFPHQAGGSGCWPPSAAPHSIVLYKQRILAKIQKTLPRKKGKL